MTSPPRSAGHGPYRPPPRRYRAGRNRKRSIRSLADATGTITGDHAHDRDRSCRTALDARGARVAPRLLEVGRRPHRGTASARCAGARRHGGGEGRAGSAPRHRHRRGLRQRRRSNRASTGRSPRSTSARGRRCTKATCCSVIDPRPFEAALRQAEANLARDRAEAQNARTEAQRLTQLLAQQIVSQDEYDQAQTQAAAMHATVEADEPRSTTPSCSSLLLDQLADRRAHRTDPGQPRQRREGRRDDAGGRQPDPPDLRPLLGAAADAARDPRAGGGRAAARRRRCRRDAGQSGQRRAQLHRQPGRHRQRHGPAEGLVHQSRTRSSGRDSSSIRC